MDAYTGFAQVYDTFMDDIPYEKWCEYLVGLLKENGIEDGLVLELGCGTGRMTRLLSAAGYDMTGMDMSAEMLEIAMEKSQGQDILYLLQDMRQMELYGTMRAIVCVCDGMNYLTQDGDLERVFALANNYLDPGGVFIFDLNTHYKYKEILADNVIAENREDASFIWENFYDEESRLNEYDLTLFVKENGDVFRRFEESHIQRDFTREEIEKAGRNSGLELLAVYDAFSHRPPEKDSERIYLVFREHGKERCVG